MKHPTYYRTVPVDGLSIFYREAGPSEAPTLLLLHGLPSSSRMFEPLFARLSDHYHLIAPDYPGFGHSDWPDPKHFAYTFDHIAEIMNHFTEAVGLSRYTLYMQDYGGPVGFRMTLANPDRVEALIVQDAVAHNEGLGENWKPRRAFWADRAANESTLRTNLLSLPTTRTRHVGNDPNVERYDPDLWTDEYAFLNRPGQAEIQSDLFYDYRTNVEAYPTWQAWMRERQPRLLVLWGKYDLSFDLTEPEAYRRDVPQAEVHVLEAGHFALDTAADEIAKLVRDFLDGVPASSATRARKTSKSERMRTIAILTALISALGASALSAQQDKYTVKVPGGLAFSEFRGYEKWQVVSVSQDGGLMAAILADPVMIDAYKKGIPGNGKPFPDGARMAKIHWNPKKLETFSAATVPATLHDVDFMVKDSKRFADSGGWGWAAFEYDAASRTFRPAGTADKPPQGNDAKCGFACHTIVKKRDYVFTDYGSR